ARHWVHNGWVTVGGEKMSKSLRNFTTMSDMLAAGDARAYRLLVLRSHYRKPIEVSADTAADAERALERLDALARRLSLPDVLAGAAGGLVVRGAGDEAAVRGAGDVAAGLEGAVLDPGAGAGLNPGAGAGLDEAAVDRFCERMDDDLDTPAALGGIFDLVGRAHAAADGEQAEEAARLGATVAVLAGALGLRLRGGSAELDPETVRLVDERDDARESRDWARADALRDRLRASGWTVEDGPNGTVVHR
ncbi:MAG: DALR domain-containing protein, partial [Trebonia sp.]